MPGYIGVDYQGNSAENLLELAKQKGKAIGVVSDAYVTDATPAGFTAHAQNRRDKTEIARQQLVLEPEVILGGGKKYFSGENNENLLAKALPRFCPAQWLYRMTVFSAVMGCLL